MRGFAAMLRHSGQAHRFIIELTEEAFLQASRFQSHVLPMLREAGAKISIDDFGVGYSSLATLSEVTADEIKVDRAFVAAIHQRPRSQSVLRAIESIGEALGMNVMAEGVETAEELTYLADHTSIRVAQGFYFGQPLTFEAGEPRQARGQSVEGARAAVKRINRPSTPARAAAGRAD
jgi:EAL domain-containing protein (putative c-di-GMP-specific phosphodiesterase class I)